MTSTFERIIYIHESYVLNTLFHMLIKPSLHLKYTIKIYIITKYFKQKFFCNGKKSGRKQLQLHHNEAKLNSFQIGFTIFFNNVTTAYKHGSIKIFYVFKNLLKLIF